MSIQTLLDDFDSAQAGAEMHGWARTWFPIPRSLTGAGVREQLRQIAEITPLAVHAVPTGTPVFDWSVPREWNVYEAWIKTPDGAKIADFSVHPLHLLGYSVPVHAHLPLQQLKEQCFSLPEQPGLIPYRTSYYRERWGFCLPHAQLAALPEGQYEVYIDATLQDGVLNYGEIFLPGETDNEILFSAHVCHPGLANDNLSGLAIATWLARALAPLPRRYGYRFVFAPGTIGAITWLARNEAQAQRIKHGLVLACLGDSGPTHYKCTRHGDAAIDRAARHVLERSGAPFEVQPFTPYGYDERQYNSPGFQLPVACFMRTPPGAYPEYHTSGDDLELLRPEMLADSLRKVLGVLAVLEGDAVYENLSPKCEPQLGKRGLYGSLGGTSKDAELALLWVLNFSDGAHSLLDIAQRAGLPFAAVRLAADKLLDAGLLAEKVAHPRHTHPISASSEVDAVHSDFSDEFLDEAQDKRRPGEAPATD